MIANILKSMACVIIILINEGQPLQCWTCTSASDPSCGDPFQPQDTETGTKFFLMDCEDLFRINTTENLEVMQRIFGAGAKTFCRKVVFTVYGTTIVQRGCSFGDGTTECDNHEAATKCSSEACYEDGCNAAATYDRVALLFTPIIVLSYLRF